MRKEILALGLIAFSATVFAQGPRHNDVDTLKIQEIEDIVLHKTGNPNKGRSFTAKSLIPLIENPQPIQMVTHEIIEQQQAKQLSDVIKNVNGMYLTSARGGAADSFGGRGFVFGNENIFKNGSKSNSGVFPEVTGLERVEVLKGANAMLYGNVGPGGIVNMVTKKPRFQFGGSLGMNIGSWNSYKPMVDIYGPLSRKVAFRVNGTYEYADSFRDVVHSDKQYFNPSFAFNIGENTQIFVEGDYLKHHFTPDFGIGTVTNSETGLAHLNTGLSRTEFLGEDWNYQTVQQATGGITLNHKFNDNWYLNSVASYQNYTKDFFSMERVAWNYKGSDPASVPTWKRILNKTYNEDNSTSFQVNLNGEFSTGKLKHKVLFGADAEFAQDDAYAFFNPENGKKFDRNYAVGNWILNDRSTWTHFAQPNAEKLNRTRINSTNYGIYVQDFLELSKYFKVLAGIRYSHLQSDDTADKNFREGTEKTLANSGKSESAFSPKAGLVFTPTENFTVYGTYTNSFSPNSGFDIDGNSLQASIIDQFEIGLKKNILDNAVAFNINAYQINNRDTYTSPFIETGGTAPYKVYAGNIRSRGVELDITGNPNSQLSLIGGVSYNNTVYTDTPADGFVEGQKLWRTPEVTANASAFYKFDKTLKGLIFGATAFHTGKRMAGWNDVKGQPQQSRMFEVKGFTNVDLSLGYEHKKFLIQGKLGNIFDVENYNVHENYSVNPITPRNFYFTLTYKL